MARHGKPADQVSFDETGSGLEARKGNWEARARGWLPAPLHLALRRGTSHRHCHIMFLSVAWPKACKRLMPAHSHHQAHKPAGYGTRGIGDRVDRRCDGVMGQILSADRARNAGVVAPAAIRPVAWARPSGI